MNKLIIFRDTDGGVAIIIPTPESICAIGIEAIAHKDVPSGAHYKIIDASDVPSDRTFRAAWTIDEALLTDGAGAEYGNGTPWSVVGYTETCVLVRHIETGEEKELSL